MNPSRPQVVPASPAGVDEPTRPAEHLSSDDAKGGQILAGSKLSASCETAAQVLSETIQAQLIPALRSDRLEDARTWFAVCQERMRVLGARLDAMSRVSVAHPRHRSRAVPLTRATDGTTELVPVEHILSYQWVPDHARRSPHTPPAAEAVVILRGGRGSLYVRETLAEVHRLYCEATDATSLPSGPEAA